MLISLDLKSKEVIELDMLIRSMLATNYITSTQRKTLKKFILVIEQSQEKILKQMSS